MCTGLVVWTVLVVWIESEMFDFVDMFCFMYRLSCIDIFSFVDRFYDGGGCSQESQHINLVSFMVEADLRPFMSSLGIVHHGR